MDDDEPFRIAETMEHQELVMAVPTAMDLSWNVRKANLQSKLFNKVREPTRIGRFALIERLGVGGMGEVYAAYDEQLDRKVAIKLVRPDRLAGASGATDGARLLREARALARLSHPNVVQVYDAGMFGDRVFVAMEFIRGRSLRRWIEEQGEVPEPRRWRRVLEMYVAAGRGLQAAHATGLVHRDFKPDNVLVGEDGRVCVVDFGLARSIQQGCAPESGSIPEPDAGPGEGTSTAAAPQPVLTSTGVAAGTPAYMAPEQMKAEPGDSRSDQFGFCVALYEALYGRRPFVAENLARLRELVIMGGYAAPPPDTQVPARIWKLIERGLAPSPADRYPDMSALLAALARDPAQLRRRWLVTVLLVFAGALGAAVALRAGSMTRNDPCALAGSAATWSLEVAERARAAFAATGLPYAQAAWDRVSARLQAYAGELQAERRESCEATHVRHEQPDDVFRLKAICLDRRERYLQALQAELVVADASTVERSTEAVDELPSIHTCRESDTLALGVQPPDDPVIAARVSEIREKLARARMQQLSSHRQQALGEAEAALAAARSLEYSPVLAEALHQVGSLRIQGGTSDEIARAEEELQEALDLAESHRHDELVSDVWLDLVLLAKRHHPVSDIERAHEWARRAESTSWRMQDDSRRARALGLRGALYYRENKLELAERQQREALELAMQSNSPDLALSDRWLDLGNTLEDMGRTGAAREAYDNALAIRRTALGDGHPGMARLSYDFGRFLRVAGELDTARELLEDALAGWMSSQGTMSLDVADVHLELGLLEEQAGRLDQAEEHVRTARDLLAKLDGAPLALARAEVRMGLVAFSRRHFADALAAFERGLAIRRRAQESDRLVALTLSNIGEALAALGRFDEALARIGEAEATLERTSEVSAEVTEVKALLLKGRGLALLGKGNARAAVAPLERALILLESRQPGLQREMADVEWALAQSLRTAGGWPHRRARSLAESALERYRARGPAAAKECQDIMGWLGAAPNK